MIERETVSDDNGPIGDRVIGIRFHRFDPPYSDTGNCVVCGDKETALQHDVERWRTYQLRLGNEARLAAAAVRREVKSGELTVVDALSDPRAASLNVLDLVAAQAHWSRESARLLLSDLWISELKKVKNLTARQRQSLINYLTLGRAAA